MRTSVTGSRKNKGPRGDPKVRTSKRTFLEDFPRVVEALRRYVPLAAEEKHSLALIEDAVRQELVRARAEDKAIAGEAKVWAHKYMREKERQVAVTHRKSGFTGWIAKTPGSAFKPK